MTTEPLDVLILNALMTQLTVPALTSPATPVASPLVTYTPTPGTPYFDARSPLRAEPDSRAIAYNQSTFFRGVFQVDAVVPDGGGEAVGLRLAALVAARFPEGTDISTGGIRIQFQKPPTIATAVKDAPWVRFPVSISYLVIN